MGLTVKTAPTVRSIDVDLVKSNKRILHDSEDGLIDFWIAAADEYVSSRANIALGHATYTWREEVINPCVALPRPPFKSVVQIRVTRDGEAEEILDLTDLVTYPHEMMRVVEIPGVTASEEGTIEVDFIAGEDDAAQMPQMARMATLLLASHWYTSREAAYMDKRLMDLEKKIPYGVDTMIQAIMVPNVTAIDFAS